ncbi:RNA 2',3'-cyclic phosphodiesterase [Aidingimonas halophila]|uniref:RNA 2',3'-cyclic phosphodiesterase n=1 Tax=Aidingimonas halophila TaxID=574349 RepID=A0A1H2XBS6_9GAMM|nr:RNA 2',3'-cyclic phosphodiesterase [Aidingimonas halophila]GHC28471.1 RNA 2',3'-cyclic phosphodiesterase [Aidingimonas halophila]SDW90188.1 2'-5' RNA ligase [Aidingimonas halophila]
MRLFLALRPDPTLRRQLGELADQVHARYGGRRMPDSTLHATLAFLGEVTEARCQELEQFTREWRVPSATWRLDRFGYFHGPKILWVGGHDHADSLLRLHGELWQQLERFGFSPPSGHFVPHVTLLRKAPPPDWTTLPDIGLEWRYNQLTLIQSIATECGQQYQPLAQSPTS